VGGSVCEEDVGEGLVGEFGEIWEEREEGVDVGTGEGSMAMVADWVEDGD